MVSMNTARAERRRSERDRGERDLEARDRDLQRLGRTDLLNLHRDFDYWNPPDPAAIEPTEFADEHAPTGGDTGIGAAGDSVESARPEQGGRS